MLIGDGIKTGLSKMGLASTGLHKVVREKRRYIVRLRCGDPGFNLTRHGWSRYFARWREKGQREPVLILTARDALANV